MLDKFARGTDLVTSLAWNFFLLQVKAIVTRFNAVSTHIIDLGYLFLFRSLSAYFRLQERRDFAMTFSHLARGLLRVRSRRAKGLTEQAADFLAISRGCQDCFATPR
jgi:hypothetical protein